MYAGHLRNFLTCSVLNRLSNLYQQDLAGEDGASRCEPVEAQEFGEFHPVLSGNEIGGVPFQDGVGSGLDFLRARRHLRYLEHLTDAQTGALEMVQ